MLSSAANEREIASALRQTVACQRERIEELEVENARLRKLLSQSQNQHVNRIRTGGERRILSAANAEGISRLVQRDTEFFGQEEPRQPITSWEDQYQRIQSTPPPPNQPPPCTIPPLNMCDNSPKYIKGLEQGSNQYFYQQDSSYEKNDDQPIKIVAADYQIKKNCVPYELSTSKQKETNQNNISLWIAHDNSTLAQALAETKQAEVLLETKQSSQSVCFVLGRVAFSGPIETAPALATGSLRKGSRGAFLLQMHHNYARIIDFIERSRPGTSEFECLPLKPVLDCVESESKLNCINDIQRFFKNCDSRVDLILCPQRLNDHGKPSLNNTSSLSLRNRTTSSLSSSNWFPYWDSDEPARKLAPQFRSAGVGYLRLGDDMSRNGLAFVSADGSAFLSDAGSIEHNNNIFSPKSPLSPYQSDSASTSLSIRTTNTSSTKRCLQRSLTSGSSSRSISTGNIHKATRSTNSKLRHSRYRQNSSVSTRSSSIPSASNIATVVAESAHHHRCNTEKDFSLVRAGASRLPSAQHTRYSLSANPILII